MDNNWNKTQFKIYSSPVLQNPQEGIVFSARADCVHACKCSQVRPHPRSSVNVDLTATHLNLLAVSPQYSTEKVRWLVVHIRN